MTTIEGACHCGAVRWRFNGTPEGATACNCTVCRRHGTLWIYGHEGEEIEVLDLPIEEALAMIADGRIIDGKAIILLQYAALNIFPRK